MTTEFTQPYRVAAVAAQVVFDKTQNLAKMRQIIQTAAQEGVALLVFPEGMLQGFMFHTDGRIDPDETQYLWEQAETVPGPSTQQISQWAAEYGMYIVFGLWELVEYQATPLLFNSTVLLGPSGVVGVYRKVHQPTAELHHYTAGREWPVFETAIGTIGMMICYDQCFPEAGRELTLRGADLLVIPNAWPKSDQASDDRYDFFGRARATENARWVLQSNQVGPSGVDDIHYLGNSRVIAPTGMVIASTEIMQEGLAIAEIIPLKFDPTRARSGWYLQQRVPSTYTTLTKPISTQK